MLLLRALLLLLVIPAGCSDDTGPDEDFHFSGVWAGRPWLGDAEALLRSSPGSGDTLYLFGVRPIGPRYYPEEVLRFRVLFQGPGAYTLAGDAVEYVVLTGGDVVEAQYDGQSPTAGVLTVQTYDVASRLMTGTVVFDAVSSSRLRPYGPTARFEGGQFRVRVDRSE